MTREVHNWQKKLNDDMGPKLKRKMSKNAILSGKVGQKIYRGKIGNAQAEILSKNAQKRNAKAKVEFLHFSFAIVSVLLFSFHLFHLQLKMRSL